MLPALLATRIDSSSSSKVMSGYFSMRASRKTAYAFDNEVLACARAAAAPLRGPDAENLRKPLQIESRY
jgi:hypothetical protein